ncbi:putative late blight resistance protein homolog R1B-16 [Cynara cardunculus var. scolymus]|uniref:putative late blight resistance protein homolog R1B-16 n=1 Tax=Cynara cardunculus var. scolymus TaxID=59895 RepID=UPI000D625042|nr:putative late blight resistance protein homolog R1B-16 [Cynara cardunculus var. scolymus]
MEEALLLSLKRLLIPISCTNMLSAGSLVALDRQQAIRSSLVILLNQLRKMMLGYENEEVQGLLDVIELLVDRKLVAPQFGKSFSDGILEACEKLCNIRFSSIIGAEENVVGFDDEVATLLDQLTSTSTKQLQVISIAGMAGLGKTTLARKLYKDPLIEYVFDIRAWICVSQVYLKRDLLLGMLSSFINDHTEEIYKMSDEQLGEKLYRHLKDRRYLVVLDDIWDCNAWNDLRMYFPDDKTGSRVLFTSRDIDLSLHVRAARPAHVLRLRTYDESWQILQVKVFRTGICPSRLETFGRVITRKCEGLPLAIIITAGLLKNEASDTWWSQIAGSLHSFMVRDPSQYMESLTLSYNHLPPLLRQCFVFVGVFPEDDDIPVTKLIWLWVAQGFIDETGCRILEDVAQDLLMDLIKRSLLMIAKTRADGQIKACRIHDLLRDLCLRKAKEENISPQIYKDAPVPAMTSPSIITNTLHGTSLDPPALLTHSGFYYPFELGEVLLKGGSIIWETYKSLRIIDMETVPISLFPADVIQLGNLRYLAIQARDGNPQASISNLVNLQMLIISSRKNIVVPKTLWSMVNLRHVFIKSGENLMEEPCFVQETEKDGCPSELASLQTLSQISPQSCHNIFSRTPNLRKLGFCGPLISSQGNMEFPNIRSLVHLQKLKLLNTNPCREPTRLLNTMMFPEKLKKLTLSTTGMDWEEMWTISLLPNLEVLKLKFHACVGEMWEMSDTEIQRLKILKLHGLDLRQWVCSKDNFPGLQSLVVHDCLKLESIPSNIGKILTLNLIEVRGCNSSAWVSAQDIQKEQESEGNHFLKVQGTNNLGSVQG